MGPGDPLPDFKMVSVNGDTLIKDSLKGSVMVLNFWASWCQPARRYNRELTSIYEKYRKLNLKHASRILFINYSIDTEKEIWRIAKMQDNLYWPYHIMDLKGWESPVVEQFHLRKIPSNYIVNAEGKIVARDLWGKSLDSLLSILNKQMP